MEKYFHIGPDHPLLKGHKVFGHPLLPGLAYIDLLFQFFQERGYLFSELELRNLSIYRPLSIEDGSKILLRILCVETEESWRIKVDGRMERDSHADGGDILFVTAEMRRRVPVNFDERLQIESVRSSAAETKALSDVYERCRHRNLSHSGIMKAEGSIFVGDGATCFHVVLSPEALAGCEGFMFHPALIDGACIGSRILIPGEKERQDLLLPLSFESFRACELIQRQCFARIHSGAVQWKGDLLCLNIEFFDEVGRKVAELGNFMGKPASQNGMITPARQRIGVPPGFTPIPASGSIVEFLQRLIASGLNCPLENIDPDRGFYDLGMDSAMLLHVVEALREKLSVDLPPTLLFEYTTIRKVAEHLEAEHPGKAYGSMPETEGPIGRRTRFASASNDPAPAASRPLPQRPARRPESHEIAVIGLAGRYPGAPGLDSFWANLLDGKDCVSEIPPERWDPELLNGLRSPSGKRLSKWGGFIDRPDCFDAAFFNISPREAKSMDPQERLFLEVCWAAIEDAGYIPENLVAAEGRYGRRKVGVFVGVMHNDYALIGAEAVARGEIFPLSLSYAPIANRVSYVCDFHGPSIAIDTVCSSSLTAIHLALESIKRGESRIALAGGVNLSLHPHKYKSYGMLDLHASDGRCRSFGRGGDGYVSSEGIGAVLLKPLRQAMADRDHVYAVIRGSVINHGGRVSGISVPSPVAQADMIAECFEEAGVDPRTVSYVEAHGTGTSLGDPIEIEGLVRAFRSHSQDRGFCAIGSLKSNIGHAEAAAGIAGLSKVVLQLHHKTLVRSLHSSEINPHLALDDSPFFVQQKTEEWRAPDDGSPRRAGLSSFGATGSNAHLIAEEFVGQNRTPADSFPGPWLIPFSAKDRERLELLAANFYRYLLDTPSIDLACVAYTLQVGRRCMEERMVLLAENRADLLSKLQLFVTRGETPDRCWLGTGKPGIGKHGSGRTSEAAPSSLASAESGARHWQTQGEPERIAEAWARGTSIDWESLYGERKPRRVSLPTYPFAKERYWAPGGGTDIFASPSSPAEEESIFYTARWESAPVAEDCRNRLRNERITVFVATDDVRLLDAVEAIDTVNVVIPLTQGTDPASQVEAQTLQLFRYAKDHLKNRRPGIERVVAYVPYRDIGYPYRSLMGVLRSLALESPSLETQLVLDAALDSGATELMCRRLQYELGASGAAAEILYDRDGRRKVFRLRTIDRIPSLSPSTPRPPAFKRNGVYWITGGMGGLGRLFADRILEVQPSAHLVLSGRSPLNSGMRTWLERHTGIAGTAEYFPCDTRNPDEVRALAGAIMSRHGKLDGLIHCAGVIRDAYVVNKTEEEISQVLSAKVQSTLILDEMTRDRALDFFVLFSSVASFGSAGQLDYATANAFLDAFAEHRNSLVAQGKRLGKTLSINWPLWKEGGMSPGKAYEDLLFDKQGMLPLPARRGLDAFETALGFTESQIGLAVGIKEKILKALKIGDSAAMAPGAPAPETEDIEPRNVAPENLLPGRADFHQVVRHGIANIFAMEPSRVDLAVSFIEYGADSIMLTEFANLLNTRYATDYAGSAFLELDCGERVVEHLEEKFGAGMKVEAEPSAQSPTSWPVSHTTDEGRAPIPIPDSIPPVAIVGFDGSFPDAPNLDRFWENIAAKRLSVRETGQNQWKQRGVDLTSRLEGRSMKWAGLMNGVDEFDASFWGIGKEAAGQMDPQLRLLLRSVWHCIEGAGYAVGSLAEKKVGVFIAADSVDYLSVLNARKQALTVESGLSLGMLANRLSYYLNFHGPSESIDTACSSVYVALNRAVQAIRCGQCDMAVVGAAKVLLDPAGFGIRERGNLLSASGLTRSFDAAADGYVRGEGVGCLLLKALPQAEADRDSIHAVVAGIDLSHNGREGLSPVAPDVEGQCRAMRAAYRRAGIDPATVNYIEAHGTATGLNDAAEMAAYRKFFKEAIAPAEYRQYRCAISTVKPNIGHLEGASGMASLIKALLAIRLKKIPPVAAFTKAHPSIFLEKGPFYIPVTLEDWQAAGNADVAGPRRVALHSAGLGGVNAHVILEEYLTGSNGRHSGLQVSPETYALIVISARSSNSLARYFEQWLSFMQSVRDPGANPELTLHNIAYTSRVCRDAMPFRAAFVAKDVLTLTSMLGLAVEGIRKSRSESSYMVVNAVGISDEANRTRVLPLSGAPQSLEQLSSLADAWVAGRNPSGNSVAPETSVERRRLMRVDIPRYPFESNKYWCRDEFETLFYETFDECQAELRSSH